jgi:hypothetical protein
MFKQGLVKIKGATFDKRKDAGVYATLTTKMEGKEVLYYFLGNTLAGNYGSIYNFGYEGTETYKDYRRKLDAISHIFYDELTTVSYEIEDEAQLYESVNGKPPLIVKFLLGGLLSLETVLLIHMHCRNLLELEYTDYIWAQKKEIIEKYTWFFLNNYIKYNEENIKKQYAKIFS